MRLPSVRDWLRYLLVPLGLMIVVPGWFIAVIVNHLAARRPRREPRSVAVIVNRIAAARSRRLPRWHRLVLVPVIPVLGALVLVLALDHGIQPLAVLAAVPILGLIVLMAADGLSAPDAQGDELLPQFEPKTTWRLLDRNLSTWGVWRGEIASYPPGVEGFGDHRMVENYVCDLIRDWSFRSGWPYSGCRVRQVSLAAPGMTGTFPVVAGSEMIYSVTLAVGDDLKPGWMRLGDGFAEFQLDPEPWSQSIPADVDPRNRVIRRRPPELQASRQYPALAEPHPLWDRWLDG